MIRSSILLAVFPALLGAQVVSVQPASSRESAAILRDVLARPHVVRMTGGRVDLPRDSSVTSSVLVIGRSATVASRVQGDVVVVGGDLFLHPGVEITGRAIAIGGTVTATSLGRVAGETRSFRDETYDARADGSAFTLTYRSLRLTRESTLFGLAGLQGFLAPSYDRVDGLVLPVGATVTFAGVEVQGSAAYISRLGTVDPRVDVLAGNDSGFRFEGFAARLTRSNDRWIYSDLVNSALVLFTGKDTRNYFRSRDVEGRMFYLNTSKGRSLEPFIGGRFERTSPITGVGNVWSFVGRKSDEKMARPNPLVESGDIGSALAGLRLYDTSGVVASKISAELEQSVTTMTGTSNFTQLTLDVRTGFPTFGMQRLQLRGHAVATSGDHVPLSRYAYLGANGTLPVVETLELGGDQLFFLETRYLVPLDRIVLPMVGSPVLTVTHWLGGAGVREFPHLEQEIGAGLGVSVFRFDVATDVARKRGTKVGVGISLGHD